MYYFII